MQRPDRPTQALRFSNFPRADCGPPGSRDYDDDDVRQKKRLSCVLQVLQMASFESYIPATRRIPWIPAVCRVVVARRRSSREFPSSDESFREE